MSDAPRHDWVRAGMPVSERVKVLTDLLVDLDYNEMCAVFWHLFNQDRVASRAFTLVASVMRDSIHRLAQISTAKYVIECGEIGGSKKAHYFVDVDKVRMMFRPLCSRGGPLLWEGVPGFDIGSTYASSIPPGAKLCPECARLKDEGE